MRLPWVLAGLLAGGCAGGAGGDGTTPASWTPSWLAGKGGSSTTVLAPKTIGLTRQGLSSSITFLTRRCLSRKSTSIGKRMKNMWIELQGSIQRPLPRSRLGRPMRPTKRDQELLASSRSSTTTRPVSATRRRINTAAGGGAGR